MWVVLYVLVRNSIGQTVAVETDEFHLDANSVGALAIGLPILPGNGDFVSAFALTTTNIPISETVIASLASGPFTTQIMEVVGSPGLCPLIGICLIATYRNTSQIPILGIVFAVVHNRNGQTVYYTTATITPAPGQTVTSYLILAGLTPGSYNASIFVVLPDQIPVSLASTVGFQLK